jgi:hypothetical protein
MSNMGRYCKAYPAEAFRAYPGWSEKVAPLHITAEEAAEAAEAENNGNANAAEGPAELDYYYLQEDYTVTAGIFLEEDVAFDAVTPEWKEFCTNTLNFEIPNYEMEDQQLALAEVV